MMLISKILFESQKGRGRNVPCDFFLHLAQSDKPINKYTNFIWKSKALFEVEECGVYSNIRRAGLTFQFSVLAQSANTGNRHQSSVGKVICFFLYTKHLVGSEPIQSKCQHSQPTSILCQSESELFLKLNFGLQTNFSGRGNNSMIKCDQRWYWRQWPLNVEDFLSS